MNKFICKRCGYETKYKQALCRHLQRKLVCDPTLSDIDRNEQISSLNSVVEVERSITECQYKCQFCEKRFNDRSNRRKHERNCKDNNSEVSTMFKTMMGEIISLKQALKEKDTGPVVNNNINSITNNVQNNYINVNLKPFGHEQLDHLSDIDLTTYLLGMESGFTKMFKSIHFNDDVPENMNVRYKSTKQNLIEVYEGESWIEHDADWVVDIIINKGYCILSKHFISNLSSDEFRERQEILQRFLTDIGSKKGNKFYGLKREIFIVIKGNSGKTVCVLSKSQHIEDDKN